LKFFGSCDFHVAVYAFSLPAIRNLNTWKELVRDHYALRGVLNET